MSAARFEKMTRGRRGARLLIAIGLFGAAAFLAIGIKPFQAEHLPVRFVRVQGTLKYLDKSAFEAGLGSELGSGYWGLDLEQVRLAAEKLAWVRSVRVQRMWPDTLILKVEEHVPYARFGDDRLLSSRGVVFSPEDIQPFTGLPLIEGPAERGADLLAAFQQLQAEARELGMTLEKLSVSERNSWAIRLSDGITIELGRETPVRTFQRFVAALSLLGKHQVRSMVRADLRYRNGFAVEWKPGTEPEWSSFVKPNDPRLGEAAQSI